MLSTPALRHASYPVARSRLGSGPDGEGGGVRAEPPLGREGETVKRDSDCRPSAGTTGLLPVPSSGPEAPGPVSLSSATTAATRLSTPCTFETAAAPIEWPMIAILEVRPLVAVRVSGVRSNNFQ